MVAWAKHEKLNCHSYVTKIFIKNQTISDIQKTSHIINETVKWDSKFVHPWYYIIETKIVSIVTYEFLDNIIVFAMFLISSYMYTRF